MAKERPDEYFMHRALAEAAHGADEDEVPIGAVVVLEGKIIARAHNRPIRLNDPAGHAEILALRLAGRKLKNYRLSGCTLYVTIEPCAMCAGAIIHSRSGDWFTELLIPKRAPVVLH